MKKYIQIVFILIALGFAASCNDALELEYDGRSSLDELFKTRNGVRGYLNSCYGARIMPDINRSTLTDESQSSEMVFQGSLASLWYVDAFSASNYSNVDGQPWSGTGLKGLPLLSWRPWKKNSPHGRHRHIP